MLTDFQFSVLTTDEIIDSDLFVVANFFVKVSNYKPIPCMYIDLNFLTTNRCSVLMSLPLEG